MPGKPLLFIDFHRTICQDRFWRSLGKSDFEKLQDNFFRNDSRLISEWMLGGHTSEEVNRAIANRLNLPYDKLWSVFLADCRTMHVPQKIMDVIRLLRNRYRTILMTDHMDCLERFIVPALGLNEIFEEIDNSFSKKTSKNHPGGGRFLEVAKKYRSDISEAILIDDSPEVCRIFEGLGGTAHNVRSGADVLPALHGLLPRQLKTSAE